MTTDVKGAEESRQQSPALLAAALQVHAAIPASLLTLAGSAHCLWGEHSSRTIDAWRDEWASRAVLQIPE